MDEWMKEYYRLYRSLQKRYSLLEHVKSDYKGNNSIEVIWTKPDGTKKTVVMTKQDTLEECYWLAIEELIYFAKSMEVEQNAKEKEKKIITEDSQQSA